VAEGLIRLVEKQFRGEKLSPIVVPYNFQQTTSVAGNA
jgi:hypothetical protein